MSHTKKSIFSEYKALWDARGVDLTSIVMSSRVVDGIQHTNSCQEAKKNPTRKVTLADVDDWCKCFTLVDLSRAGHEHHGSITSALSRLTRDELMLNQTLTPYNALEMLRGLQFYEFDVKQPNITLQKWHEDLTLRWVARRAEINAYVAAHRSELLMRALGASVKPVTGKLYGVDLRISATELLPDLFMIVHALYRYVSVVDEVEVELLESFKVVVSQIELRESDKSLVDSLTELHGMRGEFSTVQAALDAARAL